MSSKSKKDRIKGSASDREVDSTEVPDDVGDGELNNVSGGLYKDNEQFGQANVFVTGTRDRP